MQNFRLCGGGGGQFLVCGKGLIVERVEIVQVAEVVLDGCSYLLGEGERERK